MRKIPKFTKTNLCYVARVTSEEEAKIKFNLCSQWVKQNEDKAYGFTCMNYGNSEPKLQDTLFYIFSLRNNRNIIENGNLLSEYLINNGFIQVRDSDREVDKVTSLLS